MSTFKKARYTEEPVFLHADGSMTPYIPETIVTNRDAYAASMHLLFKHTAEFHVLMVEIIADKCSLDSTEIMKSIQDDSRYKEMNVNPTIYSMQHLEKKDVEKHIAVEELTAQMAEVVIAPPKEEAPKKKIVRKIVKKVSQT